MRVSTDGQGRSGFGFQSQEAEIKAFADQTGFKIMRWEREIASVVGGSSVSARPGLSSLIAEAKKRRFPILISRLDRLSRDALEIEDLAISSGVEILSVRNPGLQDPVALRIQAQRVHVETNMLSERTKAGLRRAKAAGKTLGNVANLAEAQKKGAATNRLKADQRATELAPIIAEIQSSGKTSATAIADELNLRAIPTPSGKPWSGPNVRAVINGIKTRQKHEAQPDIGIDHRDDPLWGSF